MGKLQLLSLCFLEQGTRLCGPSTLADVYRSIVLALKAFEVAAEFEDA